MKKKLSYNRKPPLETKYQQNSVIVFEKSKLNMHGPDSKRNRNEKKKKRNIPSRFHFANFNFLNVKSNQEKHIQQRRSMTKNTTQCQLSLMY